MADGPVISGTRGCIGRGRVVDELGVGIITAPTIVGIRRSAVVEHRREESATSCRAEDDRHEEEEGKPVHHDTMPLEQISVVPLCPVVGGGDAFIL